MWRAVADGGKGGGKRGGKEAPVDQERDTRMTPA